MNQSYPAAIFFDFDGVIVESIEIKNNAFATIYEPFGDDIVSAALEHHKANEGISRLIKFRHCHKALLGIDLDDDSLYELAQTYTSIVEDRVVACDSVAGAEAFLTKHHQQIMMFVVSGTPEDELQRIAERRSLSLYFKEVRGSPKTKDAILSELLARYGLDLAKTLFVGDAMADYRAATACGVPFIGRVASECENPFPSETLIIEDMTTLKLFF